MAVRDRANTGAPNIPIAIDATGNAKCNAEVISYQPSSSILFANLYGFVVTIGASRGVEIIISFIDCSYNVNERS